MEANVLADITPLIPSVLKKVPWQVRAALLAVVIGLGLYGALCHLAGWTTFANYGQIMTWVGALGLFPNLANVSVGSKPTTAEVEGLISGLEATIEAKLREVGFPAPVVKVITDAAKTAEADVPNVEAQVQSLIDSAGPAEPEAPTLYPKDQSSAPASLSSTASGSAPADSTSVPPATTQQDVPLTPAATPQSLPSEGTPPPPPVG